MKPLILYHHPCMDGLFSAVAAYERFGDDAEYWGVGYQTELPIERFAGRRVYLLDFSVKKEDMLAIASVAESVIVIDHHKTAEAELSDFITFALGDVDHLEQALEVSESEFNGCRVAVHFDMRSSGAVLSWRHFSDKPIPHLFSLVEDRDLWRWQHQDTAAIHEWLSIQDHSFEEWLSIAKEFTYSRDLRDRAAAIGETLLTYQRKRITELANKAAEGVFMKTPAMVINAPGYMSSDLGNELCQRNPHRIAVIFQVSAEGINLSLRSHKESDHDVSKLAENWGGGGHRNAAGCFLSSSALEGWNELFNWRAK